MRSMTWSSVLSSLVDSFRLATSVLTTRCLLRWRHTRDLLHGPDYGGEILVPGTRALAGGLPREHLLGRHRGRHRDRQAPRHLQDETEVLRHQPERERRWVGALPDVRELGSLAGGQDDGGAEHIEEPVTLQTRLQAERNGFGQRLHTEAEQRV